MRTEKTNMSRLILAAAFSLLAAGKSASTLAQDQTRDQTRDQLKDQTGDQTQDRIRDQDRLRDPIYGSQLMTQQERATYQAKMRTLKTEQEREAYRLEHHIQMQERARVQGVTLPETPQNLRPRMGPGPSSGSGSGAGASTGLGPSANTGTSTGPGRPSNR